MRRPWLLLILAACHPNPMRDAALDKAKAAHARGDLVGEAIALDEACKWDPEDKDLCAKATNARAAAQNASVQVARKACATVDSQKAVDACLLAVGELRRLDPRDPEADKLAASAAKQQSEYCKGEAPKWETTIDDGLELIRCEDAKAAQIRLASFDQEIANARASTRDQVLAVLHGKGFATKRGATAELLAAASCLAPTPDLAAQANQARATFVEAARASIDLRATSSQGLPELCGTAAGVLAGRAVCGAPHEGAPQITVGGDITLDPVEHTAFETQESKEYVAGIIRYDNPEYQPAVHREQEARQSKDMAEQQYRRDKSDCDSATSAASSCSGDCSAKQDRDRACNRASSSESLFRDRERDYDDANRHLQDTPAILEKEDRRTAYYTVRHHTWRVAWRGSLKNDGRVITGGGEAETGDLETNGAPVAGVPADPLTRPGDRWYIPDVRNQVASKLAEVVDAALKRRASDLASTCGPDLALTPDYLDCFARARLWSGAPASLDELVHALTDASDAKRGAAYPPLRCL